METVIAEKLEAMVHLGMLNSRMKDFFDVWFLARTFSFEATALADAIRATFERRGTPVDAEGFATLIGELSTDSSKRTQWQAFRVAIIAAGTDLRATPDGVPRRVRPLDFGMLSHHCCPYFLKMLFTMFSAAGFCDAK